MKDPLDRSPRPGQIIALVGPSGCGKSGVALELALLVNGEIVTVDSMQVYRGMDIGTAKPGRAEQARIRHHLIDLLELDRAFDAAAFSEAAVPLIDALRAGGKTPILCGGTGFYFAALLGGLAPAPAGDPGLRRELEKAPLNLLLEELQRLDPGAYATIDRRNRRRVVRAVEVVRLTGKPFSQQRPGVSPAVLGSAWRDASCWQVFGLLREAEDLKTRIENRVEEMFEQGLVAETRRLLAAGLARNRTAMQAIGYRQVVEYLRGDRSLAETKERIKSKTRQLARKQMTWFRRQMRVTWLDVGADESDRQIAARIERLFFRTAHGIF
ncbi:MAG: tRNA (adenosine(37)-N6)-dimethylallyltransferase MiaA [Verrucomicrobia bacterium]|nr:tRNA (adenosine(37)-N6)-dimethylallyltransferase MiaA [Verrucomicrobiota bacterium]